MKIQSVLEVEIADVLKELSRLNLRAQEEDGEGMGF